MNMFIVKNICKYVVDDILKIFFFMLAFSEKMQDRIITKGTGERNLLIVTNKIASAKHKCHRRYPSKNPMFL